MRKAILLFGSLVVLLGAGVWLARDQRTPVEKSSSVLVEPSSATVLGLTIGSSMQEAREKLDPLRIPADYTPDQKELSGRRIYWKLRETEFAWIMAWAKGGEITRLRGVYRPQNEKPFHEIADLASATSVTDTAAKWNFRCRGGPYFRLIAQGNGQRAQTVYMFSLDLPGEGSPAAESEPEDED